MAKLCSYQCSDIIFDIYNSESVPKVNIPDRYFVTPKRIAAIKTWAQNFGITKIMTQEQLQKLIQMGLLGKYNA